MKSIIILTLFAAALSSDIIMVGDSRTYLLAQYLFPIFQGNYPAITTTDPVTYGKHNVRFDCMPGARINDFLSGQVLGNFLEALIQQASPGSYVFLWVGVNNVAEQDSLVLTFHRYLFLAQKYPLINFIVFSLSGVNEQLLAGHHNANNQLIINYNNFMKLALNTYKVPNLRYANFMNENDPTFTIDGHDIRPYLDEIGLHFNAVACKYFFDKMLQFLPDY